MAFRFRVLGSENNLCFKFKITIVVDTYRLPRHMYITITHTYCKGVIGDCVLEITCIANLHTFSDFWCSKDLEH